MSDLSIEDQDLAFTQEVRRKLVTEIAKDGKMPEETKDRMVLLSALADMDRQSLGVKKIKSDEGLGNKQLAAAATLAQLFNNPELKTLGRASESAPRLSAPPVLDADIAPTTIIEGELDAAPSGESYETFTKRLGMNQVWEKPAG